MLMNEMEKELVRFNDPDKFEDYLEDKEENHTSRIDVPVNGLKVVVIDNTDDYVWDPVIPDEAEHTIMFGTQLFLQNGDEKPVPIRECALTSICDRLGLTGPALERFSKEDLAKVLTMAAATVKDGVDGKEIVVDGKLNALLSAAYVPHPANEVFAETEMAVDGLGDKVNRFVGWYSYDGVSAKFVTDRKVKIDENTECDTAIIMSTSDIGKQSVTFSAGASASGYLIPLVNAEHVLHKNQTTKEDVKEKLDMVIAAITESLQRLESLKKVEIQYPVTTMKRLAKAIKLPKKAALVSIERWRIEHEGNTDPVTAFDLYITLCKTEIDYKPRKGKVKYIDAMHRNLLKLLGMSFTNYDMPGEFNW